MTVHRFGADRLSIRGAIFASSLVFGPGLGQAQTVPQNAPTAAPAAAASPSIATSLPLLADPLGLRSALMDKGATFQLTYTGEVLGNAGGGIRRGTIYDGKLELDADVDLEKLAGAKDAAVHASVFDIHGTGGLSRHDIDNLLVASSIEALPSVRLYEAWFEQKLADGKIALRFGQLGADTEFISSTYAALFVNSTFGWPSITATDLPDGGPAYPLAAPAVRLKLQPTEKIALLVGVFDGNPAGPGAGDPQELDRYGLNFRVNDPPLVIGEGQYSYSLGTELPGTAKLGLWGQFGRFADLRFDTQGLSLADPASKGVAAQHRGDGGIYGIVDQLVYHLPGADSGKGIGVFVRASASPSDRSPIDLYADAGVDFAGLLARRPDDTFGLAAAYAHISPRASALDLDRNNFTGSDSPVRDDEAVLEATYQAQIVPGWTVQPDVQYVFHPGGHVANPLGTGTAPIPDALVLGVRTTIVY
jgi:porin